MSDSQDRRWFILGLGAVGWSVALPGCAHRPLRNTPRRIGFMIGEGYPSMEAAFYGELRRLGYVVGQDLIVESRRSAGPSDLQSHAAELGLMDLELIAVAALPQALAVRARNPAMPMVVGTAPGLVSNGFAQSLEHPGGIVTGMDELPGGVTGRRLRLLKKAAPGISKVALFSTTPGVGGHETQLADAQRTASELGITVKPYRASTPADIEPSLASVIRDRMEGLVNFQGGLSLGRRDRIISVLEGAGIPAIYQSRLFADSGGLMAYAPDQDEQFRMAARYVDRILRGARPGDLPILHPRRYYLTINLRAASAINLKFPSPLISKADAVLR